MTPKTINRLQKAEKALGTWQVRLERHLDQLRATFYSEGTWASLYLPETDVPPGDLPSMTSVDLLAGDLRVEVEISGEEIPPIPSAPYPTELVTTPRGLAGFLCKATRKDRPHMDVVAVSHGCAAATNGHRLHVVGAEEIPKEFDVLVPARTLKLATKLGEGPDLHIAFRASGPIVIQADPWILTTFAPTVKFPPVHQVVPNKQSEAVATVEVDEILSALKRLRKFGPTVTIRSEVSGKDLLLTSEGASARIERAFGDGAISTVLGSRYLKEAIFPGAGVTLVFWGRRDPVEICSDGADAWALVVPWGD